jgi:hypothetical protein
MFLCIPVTALESIDMQWLSTSQSISGTAQVAFTLVMMNTGNVNTALDLSVSATPSADVDTAVNNLIIPTRAAVFWW